MPDVRRIDPPTASRNATPLSVDARIALLAGRQGGVVGRRQLFALGLTRGGIDARVARGNLHPVHAGVYAVGHAVVNGAGLDHAARLACGPGTVRSHRSAGVGWQLRAWSSRAVEVTSTAARRSRPGIIVHRNRLHPDDVTVLDGLPTTTVARTVFDLAEVLTPEQHARTWQEGERLQLIDVRALRAVAERNPGRHALSVILPLLAAAPLAGVAETRSPLEVDFLAFAARHLAAFGPPRVNTLVHGFEVDAHYPNACVVVELDSREFHDDDAAFERDRAKWNHLTARGEAVFPLTARRLRREPELVAEQLARLLSARWRHRSERFG